MAKFKIIISDPAIGTSKTVEIEETRAVPLIGRRMGETIDGSIVELPGHKLRITGGSDRDGFPMRPDVHGGVRRRVILGGGVGFNPPTEGQRQRKTVRGNVITDEIVQVNMTIVEKPKKAKKPRKTKKTKEKKKKREKETETETQTTSSTK